MSEDPVLPRVQPEVMVGDCFWKIVTINGCVADGRRREGPPSTALLPAGYLLGLPVNEREQRAVKEWQLRRERWTGHETYRLPLIRALGTCPGFAHAVGRRRSAAGDRAGIRRRGAGPRWGVFPGPPLRTAAGVAVPAPG